MQKNALSVFSPPFKKALIKTILIMKLIAALIIISCLQASAKVFSQKVSLSVKSAPAAQVFTEIEKQTGFSFIYAKEQLAKMKPVDLNVVNTDLTTVLDLIFREQMFTYIISGNNIAVKEKPVHNPAAFPPEPPPPFTVSGKIIDEDGSPLEGVSVILKNSNKGVTTDKEGKFSIQVPQGGDVLVFSYVGFQNTELRVTKPGVLNITLKQKAIKTDEVVVIGYGTARKKDVTGSVASVAMNDVKKAPVASFEDALGGRVAGVRVTSQSGQPGDGFQVSIRGNNSVTQENSPLYVIDGFPIEGYNNSLINPAEIESIDVLKDASATAIYGARGANGVVIITTKRGKEGPPQVNFQSYAGGLEISKKIPLLNAYEFVKLQLDINPVSATQQYLTRGSKSLEDYRDMKGVDMQDRVFRRAFIQNQYLNVRGGTAATKYSFSGNLFQQDGVIINSGFRRYQISSAIDQSLSKKLKMGLNMSYTDSKSFGTITAQNSQDASSGRAQGAITPSGYLMYSVWGFRPVTGSNEDFTDEIVDPEGLADRVQTYNVNPYVQVSNELRERIEKNIITNSYLEWSISKTIKYRGTVGINKRQIVQNSFNNSKTSSGNPLTSPNGILVNGSVLNSEINNWANENTLTYSGNFKKNHSLTVLGGFSIQGNTSNSGGFRAIQVPNESLGIQGLDEGTVSTITSTSSLWRLASFLSRVNYSFRSKYLFTANFRTDGSSRFRDGNKWAYFPSGSVAWRFGSEPFMKLLSFVSEGKLRAGYGKTGNNRVNDFSYLSVVTTSGTTNTYSYNNGAPGTSAVISTVGNKDLKWETTDQTNIGLDLGLFASRLQLTADVYKKVTHDLLINSPQPLVSGYNAILQNIGKVKNEGVEFSLTFKAFSTTDFKWNSGFNISFNRNKILQLADNQEAIIYTIPTSNLVGNAPVTISKIGNPIGAFYGYQWQGVYQYSDFDLLANGTYRLKGNIATNGNTRDNIQPGDIRFADLNGDLIVNASDYTIIGNPNPKHVGGFANTFDYKNFELNIFFQWSYGNDIANINRIIFEGGGQFPNNLNQYNTVADRWTPENQSTTMPRFRPGNHTFSNVYSTRTIEDGSYLRLKTISLNYNLPAAWLRRIKCRDAQLYASAQNLITWTKYSGYDPEVSVINTSLAQGVDLSAYPRNRVVIIGLNLTF